MDTIWEKELGDGTMFRVKGVLLPSKGYREEREYMVYKDHEGASLAVCKVDEKGIIKKMFREGLSFTPGFWEAMAELPGVLTVEQVLDS